MRFLRQTGFILLAALVTMGGLTGCDDSSNSRGVGWVSPAPAGSMPPGFEGFAGRWNKRNKLWLEGQIEQNTEEIKKKQALVSKTRGTAAKNAIRKEIAADTRLLERLKSRLKEGDYIRMASPEEIPADLKWEDGMDNPEIGDPRAIKGGTMRVAVPSSFPSTFRNFGPNSNNSFRSKIYDDIELGLVAIHPETGRIIPALAEQWAVGPDQRTIYYKLFKDAKYSDGSKVRAIDFLVGMFIRTSESSQDLFYSTIYQENISHITVYDDSTLSVTLPTPRPLAPYYGALFHACPTHFYSEFGPNFIEKYQWRVPPTTGAYTVDPDSMIRGRLIVMSRVKNWWAKDKKFYRYRYNTDQIAYNFIAEESKAVELFRIGELDAYLTVKPELWHERMEIPEVHNGYINRATFFTVYPRPPTGLFLNTAKAPFDDRNVRLGFQYAMNFQKVIDTTYRGDYQRLGSYASGYGRFTDTSIKARDYSPEKAREYFAKAGYTMTSPDGVLHKKDGTRLTVEITFSNASPSLTTVMTQLKEDALKCGIDLKLDSLDSTVNFRKIMEKRHQAAFTSWGFTPPHPSLYQGFYSGYAYDSKGNVVPYTNNITSYSNPEMDKLLIQERDARTEEELEKSSHAIQRLIHEEGIWVPGWSVEFTRISYWRWVCWPDSETTRFSFPLVFEPLENYLFWIDENIKKETLEAKKENIPFPEIDVIYDQFRLGVNNFSAPPKAQ